ncbi:MAG: hypothetical protein HDS87_04450 [Bacteroidales bacterium]|nr:hypothetical protein [Bacteroidales bacterium]
MPQSLTAAIAWRYLRKEKVKGAVGTISTVSVCAMAVATAAIICVLSVFNGFRDIISGRLDSLTPDVMISPIQGKVFKDADTLASRLSRIPSIAVATPTLSDNALIITDGHEMPVTIKGIKPGAYSQATSIKSLIDEHFGTYFNPDSEADDESVVSIGVAARMKISDGEKILIFTPKREGRVNMANPAASFISDSLKVRGIYRSDQQEFDENGILAPISMVRRLLQYDTEASAIEIKTREGYEPSKVADDLRKELGDKFIVKDRYQQQALNFKMVKIEKWVSFMLLGFILVIASFNCLSSLSMLVIQKEDALSTFSSLGMSRKQISSIFGWESLYVTLAGGVTGVILGVILTLLQQNFGLIKIAGDPTATTISVYPVKLMWTDILVTLVPILIIGGITALITMRFAASRIEQKRQ